MDDTEGGDDVQLEDGVREGKEGLPASDYCGLSANWEMQPYKLIERLPPLHVVELDGIVL